MSFQREIDQAIKAKNLYFVGEQLPPDWYAGFREWRKLAENGDPKGMRNVGYCFSKGLGTDQDLDQATHWFEKALDLGDAASGFALWEIHREEVFSGNPSAQARNYLERAASLKEPRAMEAFGVLLEWEEAAREMKAEEPLRKARKEKQKESEPYETALRKAIFEKNEKKIEEALNEAEKKGFSWVQSFKYARQFGMKWLPAENFRKVEISGKSFDVVDFYIELRNPTSESFTLKEDIPDDGGKKYVTLNPNSAIKYYVGTDEPTAPPKRATIKIVPDKENDDSSDLSRSFNLWLPAAAEFASDTKSAEAPVSKSKSRFSAKQIIGMIAAVAASFYFDDDALVRIWTAFFHSGLFGPVGYILNVSNWAWQAVSALGAYFAIASNFYDSSRFPRLKFMGGCALLTAGIAPINIYGKIGFAIIAFVAAGVALGKAITEHNKRA